MGKPSNNSEKSSAIDNILSRAEKLREKSFYPQSLRLFKKALHGYTESCNRDGMLHCMLSMGDTYRMTGNFDLAAENYVNTIGLAKKIRASAKVADAKVGLGLSLRAQGKWKEAIKLIHESRRAFEKKGDSQGIAFALWAEGGALRIKGDITGAIKIFKESYKVFKSIKDIQGVGYCLCGLGGTCRIAGRFRDSLKYYTSAHELFSDIKDIFGTAYSYCGIGNAYRMIEDYKRAFIHFKKAVRLYKKIGDRVSYSYTLWSLGATYKMIGNLKSSHDNFIRAMLLFKKTKDPRGIIYCRLGLGEIALLKGEKAIAKRQVLASLHGSSKNGFAVEECHAITLMSYMNKHNPAESTLASLEKATPPRRWKIDDGCYNRLGLKLKFQGLPLNIP